jgi:hypothetical protein
VDPSVDRHGAIEKKLLNDLGCWLGNFYFECRALPRVARGADGKAITGEFDLEHDFVRRRLGLGPAVRRDGGRKENNARHGDAAAAATAAAASEAQRRQFQPRPGGTALSSRTFLG